MQGKVDLNHWGRKKGRDGVGGTTEDNVNFRTNNVVSLHVFSSILHLPSLFGLHNSLFFNFDFQFFCLEGVEFPPQNTLYPVSKLSLIRTFIHYLSADTDVTLFHIMSHSNVRMRSW